MLQTAQGQALGSKRGRAWKLSLKSDQATSPHGSMTSEALPP